MQTSHNYRRQFVHSLFLILPALIILVGYSCTKKDSAPPTPEPPSNTPIKLRLKNPYLLPFKLDTPAVSKIHKLK